ncbi:MAG: hypothetical protein AB7S56_10040 [Halothiobacillaceae bacterium]
MRAYFLAILTLLGLGFGAYYFYVRSGAAYLVTLASVKPHVPAQPSTYQPVQPANSSPPATRLDAASQATAILMQGVERTVPQWETTHPKSKAACLQVSGGALNPAFVRCHYGIQELVTYDSKGNRKVIQERSIPAPGIPR